MEEKVYLNHRDGVTLRQHNMMEAPIMLVLRKEQALFKDSSGLKGIKCRWFTKDGLMQEAVFNTKDLIKVEK